MHKPVARKISIVITIPLTHPRTIDHISGGVNYITPSNYRIFGINYTLQIFDVIYTSLMNEYKVQQLHVTLPLI